MYGGPGMQKDVSFMCKNASYNEKMQVITKKCKL